MVLDAARRRVARARRPALPPASDKGGGEENQQMNFNVSKQDHETIAKLAERAFNQAAAHGIRYSRMDAMMDLTACHANGCPLKLEEMLTADASNFAHDVFGIRRHLDRRTGKLGDCFLPRFAS